MRVIVVGAGIGGTSAALSLCRRGIDAEVYEQAPEPRPLGGGIFVWSNGMTALGQLGLADKVEGLGDTIERFEFLTDGGRMLGEMDFGGFARELGAPTICIVRADVLRTLVDAASEVIHFGEQFTGFEQDADGVTVHFASGHEERCDALVGADGRQSMLRRKLVGEPEDRYLGITTWRGVIPFDHPKAPPHTVRSYFGRGEQFIFHPVGSKRQFWSGAAAAPQGEQDEPGAVKRELLNRFARYPEPVPQIIEASEESEIIRMDVVDRAPAESWGKGRVTLLGDAIHLMAPMAGQGACQAMEDAIVLADCLSSHGDVATRLRSYEAMRRPRTTAVASLAHRNASNVSLTSRPAVAMRNLRMRLIWKGPAQKQFVKMLSEAPKPNGAPAEASRGVTSPSG
jgi:2-polyprenyl-6-methoxyphenol hydroxylase-like FAD-dependent oxidoreductase